VGLWPDAEHRDCFWRAPITSEFGPEGTAHSRFDVLDPAGCTSAWNSRNCRVKLKQCPLRTEMGC
jgi:hypothetical protein